MEWRALRFDWNRTRAFLVSAETGSFSAAARALGVSQPTISRQIAALEEALGITVFERVGAGLELTDSGVDLLEHARAMGEAALQFSLSATGQATAIEGRVSITASETVAAHLLPPVLARLRSEHPGIHVDIVASIAVQDLRRREADIALRNQRPDSPDLIARKIRDDTASFYAAPEWIARHGPFETLADLDRLEVFAFDRGEAMIQGLKVFGLELTQAHFPIATGNQLVQWVMCVQGLGACIMLDVVGAAEPRVERILPQVQIPVPMWLVCHRELRTSRRIRLVYDRIAEMLS